MATVADLHAMVHDPEIGPPFCRECSDAAHQWVPWPCPAIGGREALDRLDQRAFPPRTADDFLKPWSAP